jgi:multidrug efflux pump subunit AcrB
MDFALTPLLLSLRELMKIMHTLLEAVLLVILVVFLFLQDWRAT